MSTMYKRDPAIGCWARENYHFPRLREPITRRGRLSKYEYSAVAESLPDVNGAAADRLPSPARTGLVRLWARQLRVHHWSKNLLVLAPAVLAHRESVLMDLVLSGVALIAFCVMASGMYLVNDVLDLDHDRAHPRKRERPLAAGAVSVAAARLLAIVLVGAALTLALLLSFGAAAALLAYGILTLAYSMELKRRVGADVITLALLYVLRIVTGSASAGMPISTYLLAFSVFFFTSLGFAKRATEIASLGTDESDPAGRGYRRFDLGVLVSLGSAAAYTAIVVFALYINSPEVRQLYPHPDILWFAALALMAWVSRIWLLAHRGMLGDDPVDFAIRDRVSLLLAAFCILSMVGASL